MADRPGERSRIPTSLEELAAQLERAALLGLELDTRYRVLAATLEPSSERELGDDGRLQLLLSPVSTVLASLRRIPHGGGAVEVLTFTEDQLVDVTSVLGEPTLEVPLFGGPEPAPGTWAPAWSLEGRSTVGDGTARTCTVSVRREDPDAVVAFDLFVRFDEVLVKDVVGTDLLRLPVPGVLGALPLLSADPAPSGQVSRDQGTDGTPPSSAPST